MQQESASFWADIKNYEERLAQDPDSYLFARLSEVYLKVHLIEDALHTAHVGVAKYPTYIAGQRALAMACYAKGLHDESRQALGIVSAALPEDVEVQKLLGRLLVSHGSLDAAQKAFRTALEFSPNDEECRDELNVLLQGSSVPLVAVQSPAISEAEASFDEPGTGRLDEFDDIIELLESDIVEEFESVVQAVPEHHDPLSTATLAELYVQQGYIAKALEIYRSVLGDDPANSAIQSRISELEALKAASSADLVVADSPQAIQPVAFQELASFSPAKPVQGEPDEVISTLEGLLDNIRRIKACR